ncbi:hypothetical protein RESH_03346 [Rhodopirellula europaea SH398]|uniref:Uncharacterized protein n=1 Tax=Rhodopirellula europaea SH398 TaxID=1263868 RepID=M5SII3_9BACT|nr:hypothetical protein RESH_03346 [Rhodopirellula europaea SH398]
MGADIGEEPLLLDWVLPAVEGIRNRIRGNPNEILVFLLLQNL